MKRRYFLTTTAATLAAGCAAVPSDEIARRWPPIGEFVEIDGARVHYWERGKGQPVVLIHGASGNMRDWTFQLAPMLAKSYRVIVFDRPGFGYSERTAERSWDPAVQAIHLQAATRKLGVERPIVVGHSWGGALAMAWALEDAQGTQGIVTLGGATMPWGGDLSFLYKLGASDVLGGLVGSLVSTFATEPRIAARMQSVFAPQEIPPGYEAYVGAPIATQPKVFRYNAKDLNNLNDVLERQSKRYPDLNLPVEILHGLEDTSVEPSRHAEGMHTLLQKSRLTMLPEVGHMPHHARPGELSAAIGRLA